MRRRRDTADQLLLAGRFVASGCLDRLCWQSLCFRIFLTCRDSLVLAGSWFWHFLAFLASGAVLSRGREASESASRKAADEAAEASKIAPRRVENRAPRRPKWPWTAVGRQMAAKTALEALLGGSWGGLGGSWAALGASLGRLGPARRSPGGPGRLRGRAPGGHFGAFLDGPAPEAEKATKNLLCQRFLNVLGSGFWL